MFVPLMELTGQMISLTNSVKSSQLIATRNMFRKYIISHSPMANLSATYNCVQVELFGPTVLGPSLWSWILEWCLFAKGYYCCCYNCFYYYDWYYYYYCYYSRESSTIATVITTTTNATAITILGTHIFPQRIQPLCWLLREIYCHKSTQGRVI